LLHFLRQLGVPDNRSLSLSLPPANLLFIKPWKRKKRKTNKKEKNARRKKLMDFFPLSRND
jgi:hypothetical protein